MSLTTYKNIQNQTENPRQTEYRIFAEITRELMDANKVGDRSAIIRAMYRNQQLWLTLQADCARDDNQLPEQTRAGIISLAIWVERHSRLVRQETANVDALINVNRTIMQGLASIPGQVEGTQPPPPTDNQASGNTTSA